MLLQPNKKNMKKLREVLYDLYKHLDSSAAIIDVSLKLRKVYERLAAHHETTLEKNTTGSDQSKYVNDAVEKQNILQRFNKLAVCLVHKCDQLLHT